MSEGAKFFIFCVILVIFLVWFSVMTTNYADDQCKKQFGQEWVGKYDGYGPDFCVNKQGEVKYPL